MLEPTDAFVANFRRYSAAETRYLQGRQSAEQLVGEIEHGMCRLVITIGHTDLEWVDPAFAKGRPRDETPPTQIPQQASPRVKPTERGSAPWARSLPVDRDAARAA